MLKYLKKLFKKECKHNWQPSEFQKLTDDLSVTHRCKKCGKYTQLYPRRY